MARGSNSERQFVQQLVSAFMTLSWQARAVIVVLAVLAAATLYAVNHYHASSPKGSGEASADAVGDNIPPPGADFPPGSRNVVFCLWNMENVFDDRDDHLPPPDEEFDRWFAHDGIDRKEKYQHLAAALLKLNDGMGPDVIVGNELESLRAAELLQNELNARLPANAAKYSQAAIKEMNNAGRHISPAVISRFPVERVRLHGHRQRILEAHVVLNGHDLFVVASHWTSHLSDDGRRKSGGRSGYAEVVAEIYRDAIQANPTVDFLACGDFNDEPTAEPVLHTLHLVADSRQVTAAARPPRLFGLLSGRSPDSFGTIYYKRPLIYDHIGVSPGMFDANGWGYEPGSVRVPADGLLEPGSSARKPWRFGTPKESHGRGYSDHLPVVVTLKVAP